jgi:hypothetical protein
MHAGRFKKKELETVIRLGHLVCDQGAVNEYNCEVCRARGYDKERACFRFREHNEIEVAGKPKEYTRARVWALVDAAQKEQPEWDTLRILKDGLNVCPEGMITGDVMEYLEQEMLCETYKTPPVAGGLEDWPALMVDAFTVIRQTHQQLKIEKNRELQAKMRKK